MNKFNLWRSRWTSAGVATIPLKPYSKQPALDGWEVMASGDQWAHVGSGYRGNIGVRLGAGLAVIDADTSPTVEAVRDRLHGLGISAPVVKTGRGQHFYLRLENVPERFNYGKLRGGLDGELRAGKGAQVVAPCSMVGEHRYRFIKGDPEKIAGLNPVRWQDLSELVSPVASGRGVIDQMPVRLVWRDMPGHVGELLRWLAEAEKKEGTEKYKTRSEAEAAVIAILILCGWSYEEIERIFSAALPGHYAEKGAQRERYLALTYKNVLSELASNPARLEIGRAYEIALSLAWPGATGQTDRSVSLALMASGWAWDTYQVQASQRYLVEHTGINKRTVIASLERLEKAYRIKRLAYGWHGYGAKFDISALVELFGQNCTNSHILEADRFSLDAVEGLTWTKPIGKEGKRLGKSGCAVYGWLSGEAGLSEAAIAERVGLSTRTVRRALGRLSGEGMAKSEGSGRDRRWLRGAVSVEKFAEKYGARTMQKRLRLDHEREREAYNEAVKPVKNRQKAEVI